MFERLFGKKESSEDKLSREINEYMNKLLQKHVEQAYGSFISIISALTALYTIQQKIISSSMDNKEKALKQIEEIIFPLTAVFEDFEELMKSVICNSPIAKPSTVDINEIIRDLKEIRDRKKSEGFDPVKEYIASFEIEK